MKTAINIVRYNNDFSVLAKCIDSVLLQDVSDFSVTLSENGSKDSVYKIAIDRYGNDSRFRYKNNKSNLGFAGAHNKFISETDSDIVIPLNPDAFMRQGYIRSLIKAFDDPLVAAASGKMLKPESCGEEYILDGTGIILSRSRRGRERGQHQIDRGQFDSGREVFGVSGTASAYRKSALDKVCMFGLEFYDEDFFAYWEDLDLSWRLRLAGYKCAYVPEAIVYHPRAVGQSKGGYRHFISFIKHHRAIPLKVQQWSWRNHLFCILKNDFGRSFWKDLPFIATREALMFIYILCFHPRTLCAVPRALELLPKMLKKRKLIKQMRVVSSEEIGKWFTSN